MRNLDEVPIQSTRHQSPDDSFLAFNFVPSRYIETQSPNKDCRKRAVQFMNDRRSFRLSHAIFAGGTNDSVIRRGRRLETSSRITPSFFHDFGNENGKLGEKLSSHSTWSRRERILQVEGVLYSIYTFLRNQLLCSYMNGYSESFKIPSSCSRTMTPSTGDCPRYTWRNSKSRAAWRSKLLHQK
jgi:hypothetical protein